MSADADRELRPPWGTHALPEADAEVLTVRVGPLTVWARSRGDEVWLASRSGDWIRRTERPSDDPPEEGAWVRWSIGRSAESIELAPVFPSRLLVVKPELSFRLAPGTDARIHVSVPLWARISVPDGSDGGRPLTELPTVELSDTWWGELDDGELGLWLPTRARRSVGPESFAPHRAVCPLDLSNRSDDELEVSKVALRAVHLSIFQGDRGFWADVTRVRYRGVEEGSEVRVTGRPPGEAGDAARPVASPRHTLTRGLRARTFSRLRALSALGGV